MDQLDAPDPKGVHVNRTDRDISEMINAYKLTINWAVRQDRDEITAERGGEFYRQLSRRAKKEGKAFNEHLKEECKNRGITFSDELLEEALEIKRQINGRGSL